MKKYVFITIIDAVGKGGIAMEGNQWIFCPVCNNKTRTQIRKETELKCFPLFCPKCKKETLIDVKHQKVSVIETL